MTSVHAPESLQVRTTLIASTTLRPEGCIDLKGGREAVQSTRGREGGKTVPVGSWKPSSCSRGREEEESEVYYHL